MPPPAAMCSKRPLSADSGKPPSTCLPQLARRPKGMAGLFVLGMIAPQRPGIGKCCPGRRFDGKSVKNPLFSGDATYIHAGGEVAEWSKAHPC